MEDRTGKPRSNKELEEALEQVKKSMVRDMLKMPPSLAVHMFVVKDGLEELINTRRNRR